MSVCNDWPGRRVLRRNRRGKMTVKVAEKLLALSPKVDLIIAKHKTKWKKIENYFDVGSVAFKKLWSRFATFKIIIYN
jgi:hypothetical protein